MTAQTTTQRTAKHRLAVKERMARMTEALKRIIAQDDPYVAFDDLQEDDRQSGWACSARLAADIAREALNPTTTPKTHVLTRYSPIEWPLFARYNATSTRYKRKIKSDIPVASDVCSLRIYPCTPRRYFRIIGDYRHGVVVTIKHPFQPTLQPTSQPSSTLVQTND